MHRVIMDIIDLQKLEYNRVPENKTGQKGTEEIVNVH